MLAISYIAVNDIADLFGQIFGGGLLMALFIIGFITVFLLIFRAHISVVIVVIIPVILGFTLNSKTTDLVLIPPWIFAAILLLLFFIVGLFCKMSLSR